MSHHQLIRMNNNQFMKKLMSLIRMNNNQFMKKLMSQKR